MQRRTAILLQFVVGIVLKVGLPAAVGWTLWTSPSLLTFVLNLVFLAGLLIVLAYGFMWDDIGLVVRSVWLPACAAAGGMSIVRGWRLFTTGYWSSMSADNIVTLVVAGWFVSWAIRIARGRRQPASQSVDLTFPLRDGRYVVRQGGSNAAVNYHVLYGVQRYALDIVKLNAFGARSNGLYPRDETRYFIFGDTVHSPCDAQVVGVLDTEPDAPVPHPDASKPAGNHIVLDCEGVRVILAHLMHGSVRVQLGDLVKQGQPIAKVGHTGNSTEPHLHIHAARLNPSNGKYVGVAIRFDGRFLARNDVVRGLSS